MKNSLLILVFSLAIALYACNNSTPNSAAVDSTTAKMNLYMYNASEVRSEKPGDCPNAA